MKTLEILERAKIKDCQYQLVEIDGKKSIYWNPAGHGWRLAVHLVSARTTEQRWADVLKMAKAKVA